ncbi:MAG: T9SS type A sorting domain-containing protein, partial [Bacteroidales bacterium]|nr:T9SS type A sorting domain-containing protein [Bacteroidales bacterium]
PTDGELNIDIRGIDTGSENRVRIIDVNGRVLTSRIIRGSGNVLTMDVSSLDAGVYVYEVFNAEGTISKGRFVKK